MELSAGIVAKWAYVLYVVIGVLMGMPNGVLIS
jgi:hypothetical protein